MAKKQGYNSRLDESMGARNKTKKKQTLKSRRKESEGMEKTSGKKKYGAVKTMSRKKTAKSPRKKVEKVMKEFEEGTLRSGKPGPGKGPKVKSRKQALSIALSEAGISKPRKRKVKK